MSKRGERDADEKQALPGKKRCPEKENRASNSGQGVKVNEVPSRTLTMTLSGSHVMFNFFVDEERCNLFQLVEKAFNEFVEQFRADRPTWGGKPKLFEHLWTLYYRRSCTWVQAQVMYYDVRDQQIVHQLPFQVIKAFTNDKEAPPTDYRSYSSYYLSEESTWHLGKLKPKKGDRMNFVWDRHGSDTIAFEIEVVDVRKGPAEQATSWFRKEQVSGPTTFPNLREVSDAQVFRVRYNNYMGLKCTFNENKWQHDTPVEPRWQRWEENCLKALMEDGFGFTRAWNSYLQHSLLLRSKGAASQRFNTVKRECFNPPKINKAAIASRKTIVLLRKAHKESLRANTYPIIPALSSTETEILHHRISEQLAYYPSLKRDVEDFMKMKETCLLEGEGGVESRDDIDYSRLRRDAISDVVEGWGTRHQYEWFLELTGRGAKQFRDCLKPFDHLKLYQPWYLHR